MTRRATIWVAGGLATALLFAGGGSAGARNKVESFAGSCSVQGTVAFDPPVTNTQQALTVTYVASGVCSGALNGRPVSNQSVRFHHSGQSEGSCLGARTTAPGQGTITFADRTVIPYTFEFQATGTEVDFALSGQRSGTATAHGSFLTTRTPPDAVLNCGGAGNAELPMGLTLRTDSPLVSERTGGSRSHP